MKVFTMVKGENDIVEDWVLYHGHLFGFRNLYVIDNMSLDGTYESLLMLKKKYGINVTRLPNYKQKGFYMTSLLKTFCINELAFPIDIDEFIVYYNKPIILGLRSGLFDIIYGLNTKLSIIYIFKGKHTGI